MIKFRIVMTEQELFQALIVRGIVFIEEQDLPFQMEYDHFDSLDCQDVIHVVGLEQQEPYATGRIIFKPDQIVKLERIAIRKSKRGKGIGRLLVNYMINECRQRGIETIHIHAQLYLQKFYQELGFIAQGDIFLEAGIEHIFMRYEL